MWRLLILNWSRKGRTEAHTTRAVTGKGCRSEAEEEEEKRRRRRKPEDTWRSFRSGTGRIYSNEYCMTRRLTIASKRVSPRPFNPPYIYICMYMYTYVCVYICIYVHIYIHIIHICIHKHTQAHTHTHTHTRLYYPSHQPPVPIPRRTPLPRPRPPTGTCPPLLGDP